MAERYTLALLALATALLAAPAGAADVRVTDGDSLRLGAVEVRLFGIDAPESRRNEPLRTPWAAAIARRSRGILVHADYCRRYLQWFEQLAVHDADRLAAAAVPR